MYFNYQYCYLSLYAMHSLRSRIRTGDHLIHMWEVKGESRRHTRKRSSSVFPVPIVEKEEEAFSSILSGPAAGNPHPNAVRVILNFGSPDKSVYYPSVSEQSRQSLFRYI